MALALSLKGMLVFRQIPPQSDFAQQGEFAVSPPHRKRSLVYSVVQPSSNLEDRTVAGPITFPSLFALIPSFRLHVLDLRVALGVAGLALIGRPEG